MYLSDELLHDRQQRLRDLGGANAVDLDEIIFPVTARLRSASLSCSCLHCITHATAKAEGFNPSTKSGRRMMRMIAAREVASIRSAEARAEMLSEGDVYNDPLRRRRFNYDCPDLRALIGEHRVVNSWGTNAMQDLTFYVFTGQYPPRDPF